MRKLAAIAAGAAMMAAFAVPTKAQVMVDMSLVTCQQYLTSDPDRASTIAAWMGGYFSASKDLSTVDFRYTKRNLSKVGRYCKAHRDETLLSAVQKNFR